MLSEYGAGALDRPWDAHSHFSPAFQRALLSAYHDTLDSLKGVIAGEAVHCLHDFKQWSVDSHDAYNLNFKGLFTRDRRMKDIALLFKSRYDDLLKERRTYIIPE